MDQERVSESPLLLAVIVDDLHLADWQAEALLRIADQATFLLLNCTNTRWRRNVGKHPLYYSLKLLSLKTPETRVRKISAELPIVDVFDFAAESEGGWQSLPPQALECIERLKPVAILKFGMGLLRVPEDLRCPILSYHHGDPRHFRGRPAGFYEMLSGRSTVGQVVQILSNRLDAGNVVAFGETKVHPHSYRATLREAYRCSPLLLPQALRNALAGVDLAFNPKGQNYRLPSNSTVLRFLWKAGSAWMGRMVYGAFFEKHWQIATAPGEPDPKALATGFPHHSDWKVLDCPSEYRFIADPFPHPLVDSVLAEGLRRSDLQGEIVSFGSDQPIAMCGGPGHFSYPASICIDDDCYMIPEISEWSAPQIFRLGRQSAETVGRLQIEGSPKLIDPTLHKAADGNIYLFANDADAGVGVLKLWVSRDLFGSFTEHPVSPVSISPAGSRMAGALFHASGQLYRLGQDCTREYGEGLFLFAVTELSETRYREELRAQVRFTSTKGPHTLNLMGDQLLFDFYDHRFSPFAGIRRLRSRLTKRRIAKAARQPQR